MQPFIQALPLTALNDALRGVINEGASLAALRGEVAILIGLGRASVRPRASIVSVAVRRC